MIISVISENIQKEHICCAIENDKLNQERAASKKECMNQQFSNGQIFKKYDVRGKVFI